MNEFQGIESGQVILKDNYPSAASEALKRRSVRKKEKTSGLDENDLEELRKLEEDK